VRIRFLVYIFGERDLDRFFLSEEGTTGVAPFVIFLTYILRKSYFVARRATRTVLPWWSHRGNFTYEKNDASGRTNAGKWRRISP